MRLYLLLFGLYFLAGEMSWAENRWKINPQGGITWQVKLQEPHNDHIEMSGLKVSVVFRYGVTAEGSFWLDRSMVWPTLRTVPNNTHASLMRHIAWDVPAMVTVNGHALRNEQVRNITLDGVMTVESDYSGGLTLKRILFPSVDKSACCEKYVLTYTGARSVTVEIPQVRSEAVTDASQGVDGSYRIVSVLQGNGTRMLKQGEQCTFYAVHAAYRMEEEDGEWDVEGELAARRDLVAEWQEHLVFETPDSVVNTMFAFAKVRAAESIFETKGGLLHGPGGESYYAAIWANDQAEYVNPFFPYLGYEKGNRSALCAYGHFARFMNPSYRRLPSSIIAEGEDIWDGAGDRGDAAMIAYGAARYALARGDKAEALELWPLIEWCLEYCRRQLNKEGVVASDSDELEYRFPAGEANLCTSSLYYDALCSAVYLGKALGKPVRELVLYSRQAKELRRNMENYFGGEVEGFQTYCYYKGNDCLRSWICMPLTVGIYDRKEATVAALFSPRLWTENGLLTQSGSSTFWDRSTLYALRGVFACGETEKAMEYLHYYSTQRLLGEHVPYAVEAWPEGNQRHLSAESGLYCRIIVEGMLGIRPTGLDSFELTPRLPRLWDYMNLRHIRAFGTTWDIFVSRAGNGLKVKVVKEGKVVRQQKIHEGDCLRVRL